MRLSWWRIALLLILLGGSLAWAAELPLIVREADGFGTRDAESMTVDDSATTLTVPGLLARDVRTSGTALLPFTRSTTVTTEQLVIYGATPGEVWTAVDASGLGEWAPAAGGGGTTVTLDTSAHDYLSILGAQITLHEIDIADDTNLLGDSEIILTGNQLSLAASIARDSELHDAVTLGADADVLLGLSGQEIQLDAQSANTVFAGPTAGGAADPTFRALVADDLPDLSGIYQPLDADLTALAGLGSTGLVARTAANTYALRTITGDAEIGVTNGDGVAGNPTLAIGAGITRDTEWDTEAKVEAIWGVNVITQTEGDARYWLRAGDSVTGTHTVAGQFNVDNLRLDGGTLSSTSGDLTLSAPNNALTQIPRTFTDTGTGDFIAHRFNTLFTASASDTTANLDGVYSRVYTTQSRHMGRMASFTARVEPAWGRIEEGIGFRATAGVPISSQRVNHYKAFSSETYTVSGTPFAPTNIYGLYLEDQTQASNNWGVYQLGAAVNNYFAGPVGIGDSTPTEGKLVVDAGSGNGIDVTASATGSGTFGVRIPHQAWYASKNSGGTNRRLMGISSGNDVYLGAVDDVGGKVIIREDGSDKVTISGGNVGIGDTTPTEALLTLRPAAGSGSHSVIYMANPDASATDAAAWHLLHTDAGDFQIYDQTDSTAVFEIDPDADAMRLRLTSAGVQSLGEILGDKLTMPFGLASISHGVGGTSILRAVPTSPASSTWVAGRAGSIVGISVNASVTGASGSGNAYIHVQVNGSTVWTETLTASAIGDNSSVFTQGRGTDTFTAGQWIGIRITTDGTRTFTADYISALLEVIYDS